MFKIIVTRFVRRTRNPIFSFDESLSSLDLFFYVASKFVDLLRGRIAVGGKKRSFVANGCSIKHKRQFTVGTNLVLGERVKLNALGKVGLEIGDNVNIGSFSQLIVSGGLGNLGEHIRIGSNVGIGEFSYIGGGGGVTIEDDVIIGQYFSAHPENHVYDRTELIRLSPTTREGILIRRNCWIGSKVTILDGVTIGENCVIAAGSVITKSVESNSVVAGVPGRVLKKIIPGN